MAFEFLCELVLDFLETVLLVLGDGGWFIEDIPFLVVVNICVFEVLFNFVGFLSSIVSFGLIKIFFCIKEALSCLFVLILLEVADSRVQKENGIGGFELDSILKVMFGLIVFLPTQVNVCHIVVCDRVSRIDLDSLLVHFDGLILVS